MDTLLDHLQTLVANNLIDNELIEEIIKQTHRWFSPKTGMIKKQIHTLIKKEYLEPSATFANIWLNDNVTM